MAITKALHVVVDDDGAVTRPPEIMERLGLVEGLRVEVVEQNGAIVITPV